MSDYYATAMMNRTHWFRFTIYFFSIEMRYFAYLSTCFCQSLSLSLSHSFALESTMRYLEVFFSFFSAICCSVLIQINKAFVYLTFVYFYVYLFIYFFVRESFSLLPIYARYIFLPHYASSAYEEKRTNSFAARWESLKMVWKQA